MSTFRKQESKVLKKETESEPDIGATLESLDGTPHHRFSVTPVTQGRRSNSSEIGFDFPIDPGDDPLRGVRKLVDAVFVKSEYNHVMDTEWVDNNGVDTEWVDQRILARQRAAEKKWVINNQAPNLVNNLASLLTRYVEYVSKKQKPEIHIEIMSDIRTQITRFSQTQNGEFMPEELNVIYDRPNKIISDNPHRQEFLIDVKSDGKSVCFKEKSGSVELTVQDVCKKIVEPFLFPSEEGQEAMP